MQGRNEMRTTVAASYQAGRMHCGGDAMFTHMIHDLKRRLGIQLLCRGLPVDGLGLLLLDSGHIYLRLQDTTVSQNEAPLHGTMCRGTTPDAMQSPTR